MPSNKTSYKKTPFKLLKANWGLAPDTSLDDLLSHAQSKLKDNPENPEIIYSIAEIQRHLGNQDNAESTYKKAITVTQERTEQRAIALEQRLKKTRSRTRRNFLLLTFLPLLASLIIAAALWKNLAEPESLPEEVNPEKFAFTEWLAKQQMVQIITTLQKQNPELSFDFSRQASSKQSPMEFMQSLMREDAIQKMKRDQQNAKNNKDANDKDGQPSFQCSKEAAISCPAKDIPNAPGEQRKEVVLLMEAYRSVLENEQDCEKIETSIKSIGEQLQWRKSESRIKADLEDFAVECFYRKKNVEKTIEHARKLQCTGDAGYINSVYWYLTAINHHSGDINKAETSYQCFQEATDYIEKNEDFSPAYVASRHRESGALAWLYFNDLVTATEELEKARSLLKRIKKKTPTVLEVAGEIDLDLLETYVTANIDNETFESLLHDINSSGRLTDGYKQIKDTLVTIYYLQNNEFNKAKITLNNIASRFKLMPEYICGWDWSGFKRGLDDSINDPKIREQAIKMVNLADCYIDIPNSDRILQTKTVEKWLQGK
jgi:tetratricopeptide (TPR) repeat protein